MLNSFPFVNRLLFSRASDYGLVKVDGRGRINQFLEKPKGADLKAMVITITIVFKIIILQQSILYYGEL